MSFYRFAALLALASSFALAQPKPVDDEEFAKLVKQWTTRPEFLTPVVDHLPKVAGIPSPKDVLGYYVGAPKTKELLFLAETIDAAEAYRLGLINRVVPHDQLEAATQTVAAQIAAGPLTSYRYMKANVNLATHSDFRALLDREAETHLRCGQTQDHKEGVRAFLEKRAAKFDGR